MIDLLKFCFSSDPNIQTKVIGESEKSCTCVAEKKKHSQNWRLNTGGKGHTNDLSCQRVVWKTDAEGD